MPFKKGNVPWNFGRKLPTNSGRTHFQKGHEPWNKNKTGLQSQTEEQRRWRSAYAKSHGYGKWLLGRAPFNKGKKGLYHWSDETRQKYNLAIQDPEVQEKFRLHGIVSMQKM